MDEGVFAGWLKQEGEMVEEGDALFELESDKATQEVESFDMGILRLSADAPKPDDTVKVGQCIGYLCTRDEPVPAACSTVMDTNSQIDVPTSTNTAIQPISRSNAFPPANSPSEAHLKTTSIDPPASPSVRRLARNLGVNIRPMVGSGKGKRITKEDVQAAVETHVADLSRENGNGLQKESRRAVSPRAAARAVQLGISLLEVNGTGRAGRIRERDVLAAAQATAAKKLSPEVQTNQSHVHESAASQKAPALFTGSASSISMRRTIADRMVATTQQTAQVTLMVKADATELLNLREEFKRASKLGKIQIPSITELFVKLVAAALQNHPELLHQWGNNGILVPEGIHISVAVDTERGLLVPVLRNVSSLPLVEVTRQLRGIIERARAHQLTSDDFQGGTFTVSNLGRFAVDGFTPILNLPQSAILGIGRIRREPTVQGNEIVIRDQVSLSLTFDHRVHDGALPAAFLHTLCEILEHPGIWSMA